MDHLRIQLDESPPIASVEQGGERAQQIFTDRWPVVRRLLIREIEREANVNSEEEGVFPDMTQMSGRADLHSIEFGVDYKGQPAATYLIRCRGRDGGYHMSVEVVFGVERDGETIAIVSVDVSGA